MEDAILFRSRGDMPSISLVTICKNAGKSIDRTLESVFACDYPKLEHVVVDGNSTDDTCDRIYRYKGRIDKFISEPDGGISDALNKAVGLSEGDYHLVVHAGDSILPKSLVGLAAGVKGRDAKVICGSVSVRSENRLVRRFVPEPQKLSSKMSVPHMGALIRKDAWSQAGGYDLRRKIAMDHLLMLKILAIFGIDAFVVVDQTVANHFLGGVSDLNIDGGFREVRDNLMEGGVGVVSSNIAYVQLLIKSRVARLIGKG